MISANPLLALGSSGIIKHKGGWVVSSKPDCTRLTTWLNTLIPTQIHKFLKGLCTFVLAVRGLSSDELELSVLPCLKPLLADWRRLLCSWLNCRIFLYSYFWILTMAITTMMLRSIQITLKIRYQVSKIGRFIPEQYLILDPLSGSLFSSCSCRT